MDQGKETNISGLKHHKNDDIEFYVLYNEFNGQAKYKRKEQERSICNNKFRAYVEYGMKRRKRKSNTTNEHMNVERINKNFSFKQKE